MEPPPQYLGAMVNVTNHCNLRCRHCFVFRDGNPNDPDGEMKPDRILGELRRLRDRHGIVSMLWMGGEPMLRKDVLTEGMKLFEENTIVTNGTIDLVDFGPCVYVVSLDGPESVNDPVRGKGSFRRVMQTLERIPEEFTPTVQVQCVVNKLNEAHLEELLEAITWKRLGLYLKPIVLVNIRGYYDPLLEMLHRAIDQRFMDQRHDQMWRVAKSVEQVIPAIQASPAWSPDARQFAALN